MPADELNHDFIETTSPVQAQHRRAAARASCAARIPSSPGADSVVGRSVRLAAARGRLWGSSIAGDGGHLARLLARGARQAKRGAEVTVTAPRAASVKRGAATKAKAAAPAISVSKAISDPMLFGPWFAGPSWNTWRSILKAAYAEDMTAAEVALFKSVAGDRDPPTKQVRELWVLAGRRAGKDSIASAIAASAAAFRSYKDITRPGEMASILCLAGDRVQARIALGYVRGYFEQVPMLKALVTRETQDGLELSTGAAITVIPNDFRTVRGRSIALAILDEVGFWFGDESTSPDVETFAALVPALATIPGSMLVGISSPHRRSGLLYSKFKESYGRDDPDVLVIKAPTLVLNPSLDPKIIDKDMERDRSRALSEWYAEFRDDLSSYIPRELIEGAVDSGVKVRPPIPGVRYSAFTDPSGGVSDSFCASVSHREGFEGETVVVDCVIEVPSPCNPVDAARTIAMTLKEYGVTTVTGDRYAAGFAVDAFSRFGCTYRHSERDRSQIYIDALPLFTAGRVRLVDSRKLITQLSQLERKTTSGRDKISHPERSRHHDDIANSVCGSLLMAAAKPKATLHLG
jgi:hypothetical protein